MKNKLHLTIEEILNCTNGKLLQAKPLPNSIDYVSTDSREKMNPTTLFIPIIGQKFDGHIFLEEAYKNGCKAFLIDQTHNFMKKDVTIIKVKDTTKALGNIAKYYKNKYPVTTIGVTGSVGKTTTKDMIYYVLNEKYQVLKNEGNQNNEIGVPKTILNLNKNSEILISEMGLSYKGDIEYYASIAKPNIAVISNIGTAHIGNFRNQYGIFEAKMEITKHFTKNDIFCQDYQILKNKIKFQVKIENKLEEFIIPTIAKHNIYNAMAAILVGLYLKLTIDEIKTGLRKFKTEKGRMNIIALDNYLLIDDSYNASKDSMLSSLEILKRYQSRKVAVLGDILESGKYSKQIHKTIGENIKDIDVLITVGEASKLIATTSKEKGFSGIIYSFNNINDLIKRKNEILKKDDTILIKGSHSIGLNKFAECLEDEDKLSTITR